MFFNFFFEPVGLRKYLLIYFCDLDNNYVVQRKRLTVKSFCKAVTETAVQPFLLFASVSIWGEIWALTVNPNKYHR